MAERAMKLQNQSNKPVQSEETRAREGYIRPAVDIFETDHGLTLLADLPGVDKAGLSINIDKGVLTLSGKPEASPRTENQLREFALAQYYRQFQLPEQIDVERVSAQMNDGVLTLQLPKAEAAKPRRIEITSH